MNKAELIGAISESTGLSKADATKALGAVVNSISDAVAAGEKVTLPGFGTFERRDRAAREARNPQTGDKIKIAKTKVPAFKAGKGLKDYVAMNKKDQAAHKKNRA